VQDYRDVSMQGHCVSVTRGPRKFLRGNIVWGRPITPLICTYMWSKWQGCINPGTLCHKGRIIWGLGVPEHSYRDTLFRDVPSPHRQFIVRGKQYLLQQQRVKEKAHHVKDNFCRSLSDNLNKDFLAKIYEAIFSPDTVIYNILFISSHPKKTTLESHTVILAFKSWIMQNWNSYK